MVNTNEKMILGAKFLDYYYQVYDM